MYELDTEKLSPDGIGLYLTLSELHDASPRYVDAELASGTKEGYVFDVSVDREAGKPVFTATAVPLEVGETGDRAFIVDQTLEIRELDAAGGTPQSAFPPLQ